MNDNNREMSPLGREVFEIAVGSETLRARDITIMVPVHEMQRRRCLYSNCETCGMGGPPHDQMCFQCYMQGKPHRMLDVYESE